MYASYSAGAPNAATAANPYGAYPAATAPATSYAQQPAAAYNPYGTAAAAGYSAAGAYGQAAAAAYALKPTLGLPTGFTYTQADLHSRTSAAQALADQLIGGARAAAPAGYRAPAPRAMADQRTAPGGYRNQPPPAGYRATKVRADRDRRRSRSRGDRRRSRDRGGGSRRSRDRLQRGKSPKSRRRSERKSFRRSGSGAQSSRSPPPVLFQPHMTLANAPELSVAQCVMATACDPSAGGAPGEVIYTNQEKERVRIKIGRRDFKFEGSIIRPAGTWNNKEEQKMLFDIPWKTISSIKVAKPSNDLFKGTVQSERKLIEAWFTKEAEVSRRRGELFEAEREKVRKGSQPWPKSGTKSHYPDGDSTPSKWAFNQADLNDWWDTAKKECSQLWGEILDLEEEPDDKAKQNGTEKADPDADAKPGQKRKRVGDEGAPAAKKAKKHEYSKRQLRKLHEAMANARKARATLQEFWNKHPELGKAEESSGDVEEKVEPAEEMKTDADGVKKDGDDVKEGDEDDEVEPPPADMEVVRKQERAEWKFCLVLTLNDDLIIKTPQEDIAQEETLTNTRVLLLDVAKPSSNCHPDMTPNAILTEALKGPMAGKDKDKDWPRAGPYTVDGVADLLLKERASQFRAESDATTSALDGTVLPVSQLEDYEKSKALWRTDRCRYDSVEVAKLLMGDWQAVSGKTPVQCPNRCSVGTVPREDMESHLSRSCALQRVETKYHVYGWHKKVRRKNLSDHYRRYAHEHLGVVESQLSRAIDLSNIMEAFIQTKYPKFSVDAELKRVKERETEERKRKAAEKKLKEEQDLARKLEEEAKARKDAEEKRQKEAKAAYLAQLAAINAAETAAASKTPSQPPQLESETPTTKTTKTDKVKGDKTEPSKVAEAAPEAAPAVAKVTEAAPAVATEDEAAPAVATEDEAAPAAPEAESGATTEPADAADDSKTNGEVDSAKPAKKESDNATTEGE